MRLVGIIVVSLLVSGCVGIQEPSPTEDNNPSGSTGGGLSDQGENETAEASVRHNETTDAKDGHNETDDGKDGGLPPGGPRDDEVWQGTFVCIGVPPTVYCDDPQYTFEVDALYDAIEATVLISAPGVMCCNQLSVRLDHPGGNVEDGSFYYGPYTGGESASVIVDDFETLNQAGSWVLSLWTPNITVTAVAYEARISFSPST